MRIVVKWTETLLTNGCYAADLTMTGCMAVRLIFCSRNLNSASRIKMATCCVDWTFSALIKILQVPTLLLLAVRLQM